MTNFSRSVLFKAASLGLFLSISSFSVSAQSSSALEQVQIQQEALPSAETQSVPVSSDNAGWNWSSETYSQNQQTPSTFGLFLRMVLALAVVLGLAYLLVRFLKRGTKLSDSDDPFLRHVSHLSLNSNRSVDVVTILDHAYIIGVSDNAVNLLGEITDKELVNSMNLYADKNDNTHRPRSFDDILSIFMPGSNRGTKNQNIFGSSVQNVTESLRRQRERLNEEE